MLRSSVLQVCSCVLTETCMRFVYTHMRTRAHTCIRSLTQAHIGSYRRAHTRRTLAPTQMYVCMSYEIRKYTHSFSLSHTNIHTCLHTQRRTSVRTYVHTCTHICTRTHARSYVHTYTHTRTHARTHAHTHTQTHIDVSTSVS